MKRFNRLAAPAAVIALHLACGLCRAGFPDAHHEPPAGWDGPVFKLSQAYPEAPPQSEQYPWKEIDFRAEPGGYARAVLRYAYEGNLEVDWRVHENTVRKWYHAPWLHDGDSGREFVHGLTRERTSRPKELHENQTEQFQNWAVGMYNAPGGHVVRQVWGDPEAAGRVPDPGKTRFPDGTVSVKLLFTQATVQQVPYLEGAFEWQAHTTAVGDRERKIRTLRLLQIDIAVRDTRADDTTGWVFGTFAYDKDAAGDTPWDRMVPVGLMWGNDPTVLPGGGGTLKETWINPESRAGRRVGWGGRLNGPVDNPVSSCLSCHSTAQIPTTSPMVPPNDATDEQRLHWFRNIKAGEAFDMGSTSLDYSLQLGMGIQNYRRSQQPNLFTLLRPMAASVKEVRDKKREYRVSRSPEEDQEEQDGGRR